MVARGDGSSLDESEMNGLHAPPTGDHEGPHNSTSSTLPPTAGDSAAAGQHCHAEPQRSISTPSTTDPSLRLKVTIGEAACGTRLSC